MNVDTHEISEVYLPQSIPKSFTPFSHLYSCHNWVYLLTESKELVCPAPSMSREGRVGGGGGGGGGGEGGWERREIQYCKK